jgi:hypothetical protein
LTEHLLSRKTYGRIPYGNPSALPPKVDNNTDTYTSFASFLVYGNNTDRSDAFLATQQQQRHAVEDADVGVAEYHIKQPSLGYQSVEERE